MSRDALELRESAAAEVVSGPARQASFSAYVIPHLVRDDRAQLLAGLRAENWTAERLLELARSADATVAAAAVTCAGYVGEFTHSAALAEFLLHADASIVARAEDALWSVWMRAGTEAGVRQLAAAIAEISQQRFADAHRILTLLTSTEPTFAEGYHQNGIALHSLERLEEARKAYETAVGLNRLHFAAYAGMGHLCAEREDLAGALRHYKAALSIHPRLADIAEIAPQLEAALARRAKA